MGPLIPAICAATALVSTSTAAPAGGTSTSSTTSTATVAAPFEPAEVAPEEEPYVSPLYDEGPFEDDAALTPEELALIGSLTAETSTTGTSTTGPRFWLAPAPLPRPTLILPKSHIRESAPRSIAEAFEPHPTVVDTARRYVPGDSAAIRGQSGHRVALYMDGIPLHHALTPSRETPGWFTIDPWMLSEAVLERPGAIVLSPRGTAGAIRLQAIEPRREDGIEAEAELAARSADRSTSTHVAASIARGIAAVRLAAGYDDYRALRISTSTIGRDHGGAHQRASINARARLFGRSDDPIELYGGFDFDRLLNVPRTDLGLEPLAVDRIQHRLLAFGRASFRSELFGASLVFSRQSFLRRAGMAGVTSTLDDEATTYFVRGSAELRAFEFLTFRTGGVIELSDAVLGTPAGQSADLGETQSFDAFFGLDLATDIVRGSAHLAIVRSTAESLFAERIEDTRLLSQGGMRASIWGPLGVRAGWTQNVYVPTLQDLRDAVRTLKPETSLAFDFGPSLYGNNGWIELLAFYTIVRNAIEPESLASRRLTSIGDVRIAGVELTGGYFLMERLRIAGSLTWSEGQDKSTGAPVISFPSVTGRGSVRYDLGYRNAYVEAHVRGSTDPIHIWSIEGAAPPASLSGLAPTSFARFGFGGGLDLGLGFRLSLLLENALDTPHRAPLSLVPGSGVDVRAALSYSL